MNQFPTKSRILIASILLIPSLGGAQAPSRAVAEVRAARLEQNILLATNRVDSAATFWADDVVITAGLGSVLRGKENYRKAFAGDSGIVYVRTPLRVEAATAWPIVWEDGEWVGRQGAKGPVLIRGRYAAQWYRAGKRWLIRSEVFVSLACTGTACRWPFSLR